MNYTIDTRDGITILRVHEARLDTSIAPELKTEFVALLKEGNNRILLDLHDADYADSSGLGAILFGIRLARDEDGQLKLLNISDRVRDLIQIAKIDHVVDAFDDEDEAVRSF